MDNSPVVTGQCPTIGFMTNSMGRAPRDITETTGNTERGDVPGWVLITLMTAGLVVVIWAMAGPALTGVFTDAIDRVTSF